MSAEQAPGGLSPAEAAQLRALLGVPGAASAPGEPQARGTRRRAAQGTRGRIAETLAHLAGLAICAGGWLVGGWLTLSALAALGLPVAPAIGWPWALTAAQLAPWCIPIGASIIETVWADAPGWRAVLFWLVVAIDAGSTYYGATLTAAGVFIPLGPGFALPSAGPGLAVLGVLAAIVFTFGPERAGRRLLVSLGAIWRA